MPSAAARSRSLDWLLAACRVWLGAVEGGFPRLQEDDWSLLGRLAYLHNLDPLLHDLGDRSLLPARPPLPEDLLRRWEEAYFKNYIFNSELLDLAAELAARCRRAGLRVALFKGPVTLARGYGAAALRIMADLDLLCRERDLPALGRIAAGAGFAPGEQTAPYHLSFRHRRLPADLELHFDLYDFLPDPRGLLERALREAEEVTLEERALPAPPRELALVLDLAHLVQHDFQVNLKPLLDLASILHREGAAFDPGLLAARLAEADLEQEYALTLGLLAGGLGWPPAAGTSRPREAERFEAAVRDTLLHPERLRRLPLLAGPHLRSGSLAAGRYLLRRLFPPPRHLQALWGEPSPARALLRLPRHLAVTLRRGVGKGQRGGVRSPGAGSSVKEAVYRRRGS